jgi:hypothetical protein
MNRRDLTTISRLSSIKSFPLLRSSRHTIPPLGLLVDIRCPPKFKYTINKKDPKPVYLGQKYDAKRTS